MKSYERRKEDCWTGGVVRGKSTGNMILDAKRIARNLMERIAEQVELN